MSLVLLPPHKFLLLSSYCYWYYRIKKYKVYINPSGMTYIPNIIEISHIIRKLVELKCTHKCMHAYTHTRAWGERSVTLLSGKGTYLNLGLFMVVTVAWNSNLFQERKVNTEMYDSCVLFCTIWQGTALRTHCRNLSGPTFRSSTPSCTTLKMPYIEYIYLPSVNLIYTAVSLSTKSLISHSVNVLIDSITN